MSKVAVGSIPEKITYVYSTDSEVPVGCAWDISWYDTDDDGGPKTVKQKVTPSFPVDSKDEKSMKRAKEWAEQQYYQQPKRTAQYTEVDNKPITNIRLLSLEERGNGGRAYKALIDEKYYVDLREDVMMDSILKVGVDPNGVLKGEYVWAKLGSQMKIVRVGSELHRLVVEFDSKKDIKPVGKGDLEIGGIYQDRKKNKAIFVGYVNTVVYSNPNKDVDRWEAKRKGQKATFEYKKSTKKKAMLFYELAGYQKMEESIKEMKKDSVYYYKIRTSHTYIEKVDQVKIPDDIVEYLRNKARRETKDQVLEYVGKKAPKQNYTRIDDWHLEETVAYNSDHLNLYPYGTDVNQFDVKTLLTFS